MTGNILDIYQWNTSAPYKDGMVERLESIDIFLKSLEPSIWIIPRRLIDGLAVFRFDKKTAMQDGGSQVSLYRLL